ncbi:MAG TPA: imidazolonepropionase [Candidatus Limnocylindria bacterium]|jgi:imidazolonepropionase|nr:imidazolonepropionase [Candidatus Limnocylindria bacterium]
MTEADIVLRGARLLTLAPLKDERPRVGPSAGDVGAVADGWVAARDGAIVATGHGDTHERVERVDSAIDRDVEGRVVMPGFVDPHTHLLYAGERWEEFATRRSGADYLAVLAAGGGIHATVRATREASDDQLLGLVRRRIGDAAELGTTTIEVKSGYGLDPDEELRQLRLLAHAKADAPIDVAVTYLAAHALPATHADDRRRFIREATRALETVTSEKLAEAVDAFVEKGVFDVDDVRPLFTAARKAGIAVTMHADQLNDVGASAYAARLGARSADHVAHASADGVRALARAAVTAVLLPGSAFFVGYAPPEARRFIAARVPVALATDHNPGTSPLEGMPTAIALGVTLCGLTPHEAIVAATVNAAHALGRGDRTGALVSGRRADIVVLETDDERELAYRMGAPLVAEVYAAGKRVA